MTRPGASAALLYRLTHLTLAFVWLLLAIAGALRWHDHLGLLTTPVAFAFYVLADRLTDIGVAQLAGTEDLVKPLRVWARPWLWWKWECDILRRHR